MAETIKIHTIIYSWPRVQDNALEIGRSINPYTDRVSIVDSADFRMKAPSYINIYPIGSGAYFVEQFKKTLDIFDGDVLLQIAGDVSAPSWELVATFCRKRFLSLPQLGIWSPEIDGTHWTTERVKIRPFSDPNLIHVAQTDCIVWALHRDIVSYMKTLDYSGIKLGWGIDWAAIAHAYATSRYVLRDTAAKVHHPEGRAYDSAAASAQMFKFISQLSEWERVQLDVLMKFTAAPEERGGWLRKLRRTRTFRYLKGSTLKALSSLRTS